MEIDGQQFGRRDIVQEGGEKGLISKNGVSLFKIDRKPALIKSEYIMDNFSLQYNFSPNIHQQTNESNLV